MELNRVIESPRDEQHWLHLRASNLNSTDVASLFGKSPYQTKAELWYRKKDLVDVAFEENERTRWGRALESAIAQEYLSANGLIGRPFKEYIHVPALKIGSSFDWRLSVNGDAIRESAVGGEWKPIDSADDNLLEVKNVDFLAHRNGWEETEFGWEAPAHIEIQAQHQMLVSGLKKTHIAALIGGNTLHIIERDFDAAVGRGILNACAGFWKSIEEGNAPAFDFERDTDLIVKLYNDVRPGSSLMATPEIERLLARYAECTARETGAKNEKEAMKAQIFAFATDAEEIIGSNGWGATLKKQQRKAYSVEANEFRVLRIKKPKGEKE